MANDYKDLGFEPVKYTIDTDFIREQEGYKTTPYIPQDKDGNILGHSGVTIGGGIDLGQQSESGLRDIGVEESIINKVKPYLGKKKENARNALKGNNFDLTDEEIKSLDEKVKGYNFGRYVDYYEKETGRKFNDLDPKFQTAIGSVVTQYGNDLKKRTPKFNKAILDGDIPAAKKELENFGDSYRSRRKREASLLEGLSFLNPFSVKEASAAEDFSDLGFEPISNDFSDLGFEPEIATDPRDDLSFSQKILTKGPVSALAEGVQKVVDYVKPTAKEKTPIFERIGKGFGTGVAGMVEGVGGVANWFGAKDLGKSIDKYANEMKEFYEVPDPDFTSSVSAGFGSMATFLVPGLGVAKASQALAFAPRLAAWLGASASAVMEAGVEAGSAYKRGIVKGMEHKDASVAATKDFWLNLPLLVFTNKAGIFGENGGAILKGIKSAGSEGIQEFSQQLIGNFATKDPLFEGALESAAVGAIVGGGTGVLVGGAEQKDLEKTKAKDFDTEKGTLKGEEDISSTITEAMSEDRVEVEKVEPSRQPGEIVRDEQGNPIEINADQTEEYQAWLEKYRPFSEQRKEYDVPLHPAEEGRAALKNIQVSTESDVKEIDDIQLFTATAQKGGELYGNTESGGKLRAASGNLPSVQAVGGPKAAQEILDKAKVDLEKGKPVSSKAKEIITEWRSMQKGVLEDSNKVEDELLQLKQQFPEITDEEVFTIEKQIEQEDLWDEEKLSRAVEIYTQKKEWD